MLRLSEKDGKFGLLPSAFGATVGAIFKTETDKVNKNPPITMRGVVLLPGPVQWLASVKTNSSTEVSMSMKFPVIGL